MSETIKSILGLNTGKLPPTKLSAEQKALFNGYDELGGDLTMYEDAATWFKDVDQKYEAMTLCIALLDKPSPWIFGGLSNEKRKRINAQLARIKDNAMELDNAVDTAVINNIRNRIKGIIDLSEDMSMDDENNLTLLESRHACIDSALIRSCSMYSDAEIRSFKTDQLIEMKAVRCWWNMPFQVVNVSRMKRAALMYLELVSKSKRIHSAAKWVKNHDGKPSGMKKHGSNDKTQEIMKKDIEKFLSHKSYWKDHRSVFNVDIPTDSLVAAQPQFTDVQQEFVTEMGFSDIPGYYLDKTFMLLNVSASKLKTHDDDESEDAEKEENDDEEDQSENV